jgi:hypothetical protein
LAIRTQGYWNYFQPVEQTDEGVLGDDTLTLLKNDKIKDFYPAINVPTALKIQCTAYVIEITIEQAVFFQHYTVKKVTDFPNPNQDVTNQTFFGQE